MANLAGSTPAYLVGTGGNDCYGCHPWFDRPWCSSPLECAPGLFVKEFEVLMSVQEPRDQFERDSVEDEIEDLQDTVDESPLLGSDSPPSEASESVDVPADESDEIDVPAVESMPLSSSDELPPPGPTEGPAWYVIHCYSGYENKVRH